MCVAGRGGEVGDTAGLCKRFEGVKVRTWLLRLDWAGLGGRAGPIPYRGTAVQPAQRFVLSQTVVNCHRTV